VLYFIAPHRLKPVDIAFMKELHEKVNLIPIIAKSDTMTSEEKRDFKIEVRETLERHGIDIFEFHKPTIDDMSRQAEVALEHPWAVIATKNAKVDEDGNIEAKRVYDWGGADAANPQHSDLLALQTLILGEAEAWRDLKAQTFAKYESWRMAVISAKQRAEAAPCYERLRSHALRCYAKLPPVYMMSLLVLFLTLLVVPTAGSYALSAYTQSATQAIRSELHTRTDEIRSYMGREDEMQAKLHSMESQLADILASRDRMQLDHEQATKAQDRLQRTKDTLEQSIQDKAMLLTKERQALWQCERDLQTVSERVSDSADVGRLKRKIRAWHAKSKAWYLEPLPADFRA